IEAINDYPGAVILVSHDRYLLEACADRLWLVAGGTVTPYDGDLDDYRRSVLAGDSKGQTVGAKSSARRPDPVLARRAASGFRRPRSRSRNSRANSASSTIRWPMAICSRAIPRAPRKWPRRAPTWSPRSPRQKRNGSPLAPRWRRPELLHEGAVDVVIGSLRRLFLDGFFAHRLGGLGRLGCGLHLFQPAGLELINARPVAGEIAHHDLA